MILIARRDAQAVFQVGIISSNISPYSLASTFFALLVPIFHWIRQLQRRWNMLFSCRVIYIRRLMLLCPLASKDACYVGPIGLLGSPYLVVSRFAFYDLMTVNCTHFNRAIRRIVVWNISPRVETTILAIFDSPRQTRRLWTTFGQYIQWQINRAVFVWTSTLSPKLSIFDFTARALVNFFPFFLPMWKLWILRFQSGVCTLRCNSDTQQLCLLFIFSLSPGNYVGNI